MENTKYQIMELMGLAGSYDLLVKPEVDGKLMGDVVVILTETGGRLFFSETPAKIVKIVDGMILRKTDKMD